MAQKYRPGTRIEVKGFDLSNQPRWEGARIGAYRKAHMPYPAGYHPVTFDADKARLLVHESGFRVVDNH